MCMLHSHLEIEDNYHVLNVESFDMFSSEDIYPLCTVNYAIAYSHYTELHSIIYQLNYMFTEQNSSDLMRWFYRFIAAATKYLNDGGAYQ